MLHAMRGANYFDIPNPDSLLPFPPSMQLMKPAINSTLIALGASAFLIVLGIGADSRGVTLCPRIDLVQENVATFDPGQFVPGPNIDIYHLTIENFGASNVTSLELVLPGNWLNLSVPPFSFKDSPDIPMLGPNTVAETFFVLPPGTTPLAVDVVDTSSQLSAAYTVAGSTPLVPAMGSSVVAVLSVLTGEEVDLSGFLGQAAVEGQGDLEPIVCIPEPSGATLLIVATVGLARRRSGLSRLRLGRTGCL